MTKVINGGGKVTMILLPMRHQIKVLIKVLKKVL